MRSRCHRVHRARTTRRGAHDAGSRTADLTTSTGRGTHEARWNDLRDSVEVGDLKVDTYRICVARTVVDAVRASSSERDKISLRLARCGVGFEADHETKIEGVRNPCQGVQVGDVPATLDTGDLRGGRTDFRIADRRSGRDRARRDTAARGVRRRLVSCGGTARAGR
jgi:hypothetical protein